MRLKRWLISLLALATLIAAGIFVLFRVTPSTTDWPRYSSDNSLNQGNALAITWLGTSTLLISDGETTLMTDGYFSRVSKWQVVSSALSPNANRIKQALATVDVSNLAAVMVVHSHFDHVMDAPWIALDYNAELVGSRSTANVGRGAGVPEKKLRIPVPGEPQKYGNFEVIFLQSAHVPQSAWVDKLTGMHETIDAPLTPPAPVQDWKEGESYALVVRHPRGNILVQGSAGFIDGQLDGYQADLAFVSSVGLFRQPGGYTQDYVRNTVGATGARQVIPIHWDDFFVELTPYTPALPLIMENLNASFTLLNDALKPWQAKMSVLDPMGTIYFRREQ